MHTRLIALCCTAVLGLGALAAAAPPATAQARPGGACARCTVSPTATGDGFASSVRAQVNQLNNGGSSSGGPARCSEEDAFVADDDTEVQRPGYYAYEPPLNEQGVFRNIDGNTAPGTYWRLICVYDDGSGNDLNELVSIDFFPLINPQNLARLAVDEALTQVPAPQPRMSPDQPDQLVNLLTWLWVDGIPATSFPGPSVSVPGYTVTVEVTTGGSYWVMGDGAAFGCDMGTPYTPGGTPTCSHTYTRSTATQPDQLFHGSASVRWTARYWVNGAGPYEVTDAVVRTTPFTVRVSEGQAVVTR